MSGSTTDLDEKVRLHKEVFQQYLESVKKNTKVISEDVLRKIQKHLKGTSTATFPGSTITSLYRS